MIVVRIHIWASPFQIFAQIFGSKSTPPDLLEGAAAFDFSSSAGHDVNSILVHGD